MRAAATAFLAALLCGSTAEAWMQPQPPPPPQHSNRNHNSQQHFAASRSATLPRLSLSATPPPDADPEQLREIFQQEATDPKNMKATAEFMKNLKPDDIDQMLRDMDNMPAAQKQQLEQMGMNPDIMRQSIEAMKQNPSMAQQMGNMMEQMTPQEMMDKSKAAQANLEQAAAAGAAATTAATTTASAAVNDDEEDDDADAETPPPPDAEIVDTLYRTAEIMSDPPTGEVTLAGFASIPPVALLVGTDTDRDLSRAELTECWAEGSLGQTRVNREGFLRVWNEVQEYFSLPILDKARERIQPRGTSPAPATPSAPVVGENISTEELQEQVQKLSDTDMDGMLSAMQSMTPEQEERMRSMGVDPSVMARTAQALNKNPMMKQAAKMMMKNMTPDQMKAASQQAQEQMKNMSPDEYKKMLDKLGQ